MALPPDPDDEQRDAVARQANTMFWITLTSGALIFVAAVVFALVL